VAYPLDLNDLCCVGYSGERHNTVSIHRACPKLPLGIRLIAVVLHLDVSHSIAAVKIRDIFGLVFIDRSGTD
jgi:hypothetical protein